MSESSFRPKPYLLLTALSALGAAISIWQTRGFFQTRSGTGAFKTFCNIGETFDCTAIEMSRFAELFPGLPLSGLAIAGYSLILILSLMGLSSEFRKNLKPLLVATTGIALAFSLVYLAIMVLAIGKLCILCLGVDAINIALFAIALRLPGASAGDSGSRPGHLLAAGAGAVLIAFAFLKGLNPLYGVNEEVLNDRVESILATPPVAVEIPADAPSIGEANAPITIVKFSDFECPACRLGAQSIHPLFKRFSKEVRFVFLNFPLAPECNADPGLKRSIHPFACEAAAVAVCAARQGKYAEAYEALFEHQSSFEHGKIASLVAAKVPGIDLTKLEECKNLPSTAEAVRRDTVIGTALKVQSTPTFFLNGRKIEGGIPTHVWVDAIEKVKSL